MEPEGQAAATEEGRVDQFPADQGGKELQIRQREFRPAEPGAARRQGRLGLRQGGKQLGFGPVVGRLGAGKAAAIHPIVDGPLKPLAPLVAGGFCGLALQVRGASRGGPVVKQLDQPGAFAHHDPLLAAAEQHRHRGPLAGIGAGQSVELQQGVAALEGGDKAPAARLGVGLHHQQLDGALELAQAPHQPGPVGPGAAAPHDQHMAAWLSCGGR